MFEHPRCVLAGVARATRLGCARVASANRGTPAVVTAPRNYGPKVVDVARAIVESQSLLPPPLTEPAAAEPDARAQRPPASKEGYLREVWPARARGEPLSPLSRWQRNDSAGHKNRCREPSALSKAGWSTTITPEDTSKGVIVMRQQGQVFRLKGGNDEASCCAYRYRVGGRDSRRVQRDRVRQGRVHTSIAPPLRPFARGTLSADLFPGFHQHASPGAQAINRPYLSGR